jgi:hypothetical protein
MIRLDRRQREALGETLRELANLITAAMVVGQIITEQPRSWLILVGIAVWLAFVGWALLLEGERPWKARS